MGPQGPAQTGSSTSAATLKASVQVVCCTMSALGRSGAVGEKSCGPNRVRSEITTPAMAIMKNKVSPPTVAMERISTPKNCLSMNDDFSFFGGIELLFAVLEFLDG